MKKITKIICLSLCAAMAVSASACSVFDNVTDVSDKSAVTSEHSSANVKKVNSEIPAPTFNMDITNSHTIAQGSTYNLDGTAVSPNGGEVTYQWYVNNISSNGGGTPVDGATDAVYSVDTSEVGKKYYYVVASNNVNNEFNNATSGIVEVEIIQSGTFTTDEYGGTRYLAADGSYPADKWVTIGTDTYYFDSNGYRTTGWLFNGESYIYFDSEGRYLPGTTQADGYYIDGNNNLVQGTPAQ